MRSTGKHHHIIQHKGNANLITQRVIMVGVIDEVELFTTP